MTSRRSDIQRRSMLAAGLGALGFVISWYLIHHGWYALGGHRDAKEYAKYARDILHLGLVPYRDFTVEYPPLALPVFVFPGWIAGSHFSGYVEIFALTMAICGVVSVSCSALILGAQRVGTRRLVTGVALVAASPVLLGGLLLSRYDLFPTVLLIAALTALYFGWERSGFALLALGTAAKAYPALVVPIAVLYVWRNHGGRRALACLAIFGAVLLACFLPFLVIAPHGIWSAITNQASRPPQIESLGAAVFLAAHQLFGIHVSDYFTHHSESLSGHTALQFASVMSGLQIVALLAVWLSYARGPATRDRLLTAGAAAVCAFIVFGRVLSPQYLIWLAPLVVVIPGRRGAAAMAMLACAMCMTQIWYPLHFAALKQFQPLESWAMIGRDLVLLALFGSLAWPDVALRRSTSAARARSRGR